MSEFIIEYAQCDFISDIFLWKTDNNGTEDIAYTICITNEQIEIYIKRILRDWSKGKVCAVFKNRNMKSPSFNAKLINHLSRHVHIFASQGLRFGSPFSPPLADLEYILRIRALKFHWLRLPVHISNQKTFYTEHMLSTKCKQKCSHMTTICHFPFCFQ